MYRFIAILLISALLLTGCAGTPQSRESGATAVVSVLGVEPAGQGIHLLADGFCAHRISTFDTLRSP